jgi:hypothetical protein|tara:strand:- start:19793 stop:20230 length:438 start_codon:yes stop_codon:yes gene_type:complete
MFNNTQDGDARLRAWRTFRNDFPHNGTALDVALGFKGIKPKPRYIDYYNPQDWPNVFDIVKEGYLCQSGVSIVIASTLHNLGFINTESLNFEMISNHVTGAEGAIFEVDGSFFNFISGEISTEKFVRDNSVTFHSGIITLDKLYA